MRKKMGLVVIGTSLTEMSDPVVRAGLAVARAAGAKIVLVHAFQPNAAYGGGAPYVPDVFLEEAVAAERAQVECRLADQAARLGVRGEELAATRVELGSPYRALTEAAESLGADLLVVGSSESPRLAKVFGSTADRVVRKSLRPVLVVREGFRLPPERVLLPVDLSPLSAEAFRRGLDLLDQIAAEPSVRLEALHVITGRDYGLFEVQGPPEPSEAEAVRELQSFVALNACRGPRKVETRLDYGEVEERIRARGDEWGADLIVIGTHGRGGFERFLLGSVAADVVRRGKASILVIPPVVEVRESRPRLAREAAAVV
jgi:nucleotide-binding universal stress UspA family protein